MEGGLNRGFGAEGPVGAVGAAAAIGAIGAIGATTAVRAVLSVAAVGSLVESVTDGIVTDVAAGGVGAGEGVSGTVWDVPDG